MHFLPDPVPPEHRQPTERRTWRYILFASAAATGLATRWPWLQVKFERLLGTHSGPPAWQSGTGFTCLSTSLLVAVMALAENGTPAAQHATRPGSLMLTALALLTLGATAIAGPSDIDGMTGTWTPWFYAACISVPVLTFICLRRWAAIPRHGVSD